MAGAMALPGAFPEKMETSMTSQKLFGLLTRRERWGISLRGWLVLILGATVTVGLSMAFIQPFLAHTQRVDAKILVVEGWAREFAMTAAVAEFRSGHYEKIYTTGGPIVGTDGATNDFNTAASVGAGLLIKDGMPADLVQMVPSHVAGRDRTYSSAIALRDWFHAHHVATSNINVLTEDAHARRTRLLFQKAFGRDVTVGIISVQNPDYDPKHWWHYSEGVREVLGESIAYVYARFLFHPADPDLKK
jgi:uncharacterized SAM-binding protein YcdF (DUF218 family)